MQYTATHCNTPPPYIHMCIHIYCPTQSIVFVHWLVERFQKIILLIVQYKYQNLAERI